ncbi:hypothetical protein GGD83_004997 [Rhodoblastus sphagnicola]|uniref:hypothetical protein n=1 Tax=Rhodoblastus sphagnicola TaxID=333368 RepID=UPI001621E8FC|nr:hypothetical protein [Rhodoblastus sphagnicola]MBB4201159.1 hypothetical protein [Rhodoblastus sphagnicola]
MKTTNSDKLSELVEINLLYAKAELERVVFDLSALIRVRQHIEQALKDIHADKRGKLQVLKSDAA